MWLIPPSIKIKKEYLPYFTIISKIGFIIFILVTIWLTIWKIIYFYNSIYHSNPPEILFSNKPKKAKDETNFILSFKRAENKDHYSISISFYAYILDWKYRYFQSKIVYHQGDNNIKISFQELKNNIDIEIKTLDGKMDKYILKNVDINRWFNFTMVIKDLRLDLYYNGKLYSSHVLKGLPDINNDNIKICQEGGFSGLLWNLKCFNYPISYPMVKSISKYNPPTCKNYFK